MPFDPSKFTLEADAREFIRRYDARCKRVLSNRMVLAHILRATMDEFADIEPEVIAAHHIEGIPGQESQTPRIQGLRNERDNPSRNANFFDVIFYALKPGTSEAIPIIINIEAQTDCHPGYMLSDRGVFYIGCMIADQKDTVFPKDRYDQLRKVCSIWICIDPPKECANSIECFTLDQHIILGNCPPHIVDKIRLVFIYLSGEEDKNCDNNGKDADADLGIIPLLNVCLAKAVNRDRQEAVTRRFHVELDPEDRDMTAGEQIIYKHYREMYELEEKAKGFEEQNRKLKEDAQRGKESTAKILKESHVPVEVIAKSTGLTVEQIEAL